MKTRQQTSSSSTEKLPNITDSCKKKEGKKNYGDGTTRRHEPSYPRIRAGEDGHRTSKVKASSSSEDTDTDCVSELDTPVAELKKRKRKPVLLCVPKLYYEGDDDWDIFQNKFQDYAEEMDWTPSECKACLKWCLRGKAAKFCSTLLKMNENLTYKQMLRKLGDRFGDLDLKVTVYSQFNHTNQKEEETLEDWPDRVRELAAEAFNSTSRYLDDLLNIDNIHFEHMVHRIYPAELQLNKANASDTEAAFLDLNLSIHNDIVSTKIYDKRDDFNFDIVNFPFLEGDVPQRPSYGVYISQLIRFARASSHVTDFNNRNKFLTAKLLKQGYRYHKLRKAFSKFYRRHFELIEKYHVSMKKLMQQGICKPEFYGDLVYKFKKIIGNPNFSNLLKRIVNRFKRTGYSLDIMRQIACLVFNPIMVEGYAALFSCTAVVQASDSMTASM